MRDPIPTVASPGKAFRLLLGLWRLFFSRVWAKLAHIPTALTDLPVSNRIAWSGLSKK